MYISFWTLGFLVALGIGIYKGTPFKGFFAGFFLTWFGAFLMLFVKNIHDDNDHHHYE